MCILGGHPSSRIELTLVDDDRSVYSVTQLLRTSGLVIFMSGLKVRFFSSSSFDLEKRARCLSRIGNTRGQSSSLAPVETAIDRKKLALSYLTLSIS